MCLSVCLSVCRITITYKEAIRKEIVGNNEKRNNQNEERSETKWENSEKVVTVFVSEVVSYVEREKGNDWYEEECQVKVEGRNKAQIEMLNKEDENEY
jgi:hypothetical protein